MVIVTFVVLDGGGGGKFHCCLNDSPGIDDDEVDFDFIPTTGHPNVVHNYGAQNKPGSSKFVSDFEQFYKKLRTIRAFPMKTNHFLQVSTCQL